ncbi:phosphotransferase family protein [Actinocrispum wychmicini]|uniref:Aminoglycoside phosphotransferase (APT) family kinase protein n=1 Tax=Actinocrispum wychmicini TaxID=1213861 RepID=A0A4R2JNN5_9PSEU|nr:aminoglycoside phosphotransferase family protein [Actinocrispum wychmicini]TCO60944.1 aminoglycoside phosphotransferase (APT) family kinase protein [Actinocrispum wychmicini]
MTHDGLDLDAGVVAWLTNGVLSGRRVNRTRTLSGGYRNHNVQVVTDTGEQFVVRRYLHGNTCAVEAALAARLAGVVPVAEVVAADPAGVVTGQPVLVSRFVPGVLLSEVLPSLDCGELLRLGHAVGATLAAIGTVTFPRPGFFAGPALQTDGVEPTAGLPVFVERCLRAGNARLSPAEQESLLRHAARCAPLLAAVSGSRQLVHSDFNPKNLLVRQRDGVWVVTAVLDWEFALASTPLFDVGNMLRLRDELPSPYVAGFSSGFVDAGGGLPAEWRQISDALDLFALADFLTRPPDTLLFGKAVGLIRRRLSNG